MRSFDVGCCFRLMPTLSDIPPIRANAVVVIVVVVVVDITARRDAKKNTTHDPIFIWFLFFSMQAIDI